MTGADYDPLTLPAAYFEGLPTGVPNNLPSQPEPVEIDHRAKWVPNDNGTLVPRRTSGSVAHGWTKTDFGLVCKVCGDDYTNDLEMPVGVIEAHFNKHHPGQKITLDLLWLGQGPAPKGES